VTPIGVGTHAKLQSPATVTDDSYNFSHGISKAEKERSIAQENSIVDKVEEAAKDAFKKVEKVFDEISADEEPVTVTYPDRTRPLWTGLKNTRAEPAGSDILPPELRRSAAPPRVDEGSAGATSCRSGPRQMGLPRGAPFRHV
jgi:hypothetical protein